MILIFIGAFLLRLYGLSWDQGFHLHPDERMLIMVADRIHFFGALDPQFFNYGSLPLYLLKGISQLSDTFFNTSLATYDHMLIVGRLLSIAFDLGTVVLIYLIAQLLFKKGSIALYASLAYAISFFTIQNSHFFVVDVFLTFFLTATIYALLLYLKKPLIKFILLLSAAYGAALATKVSAILFLPVILAAIFMPYLEKKSKKPLTAIRNIGLFAVLTVTFHFIFMPYAYLSFKNFLSDTLTQTAMSHNAYIFPYTLQYVDTLPYLYFLRNLFLWGFGPILSALAILGINELIKIIRTEKTKSILLVSGFYLLYFMIIGASAVKFMRYMLPVYPFFALLAGLGLHKLHTRLGKYAVGVVIVGAMIWMSFFINIYSFPHTRIAATNWILQNIPPGSTLAIEHWDDQLPLINAEKYQYVEMTLYDQPDDEQKWNILRQKLAAANYIILASNRLYVPLQELSNCTHFKICYPTTAQYYKDLFDGKLGFKKVYEAHVYPSLTLFGKTFDIDDQSADESFTVYDHPKVIIFQKKL